MDEARYETQLPVRFRDLDAVGHVNNAVYATYLEQARLEFVWSGLGGGLADIDMVVASLSIDFRQELPGDTEAVTVAVGVREVGDTSFRLGYEVRRDGEVAAAGETAQVHVDPATGEPRPLPDAWRAWLTDGPG